MSPIRRVSLKVSAELVRQYKAVIRSCAGDLIAPHHRQADGGLSNSAAVEIALAMATKLARGHYDQKFGEAFYRRINREIAAKIAEGIAAHIEGAEVGEEPDGWPCVVIEHFIRLEDEPDIEARVPVRIPLQREYIRAAAPTVQ